MTRVNREHEPTVGMVSAAELRRPRFSASEEHTAALRRLLTIAAGDTGQSRRVADFLLAWWNPGSCGGFDFTAAWGVDAAICDDLIKVFELAVRCGSYPDTLGYSADFERVIRQWGRTSRRARERR
jgi:hypothetical protein